MPKKVQDEKNQRDETNDGYLLFFSWCRQIVLSSSSRGLIDGKVHSVDAFIPLLLSI